MSSFDNLRIPFRLRAWIKKPPSILKDNASGVNVIADGRIFESLAAWEEVPELCA